ncbi:histidine kinase dimerization/phosphoacceptor domain -containing protein [Roseivirga seohaensis]|uniref:histidine kinase dimerization/phosphoacceptor domain -containing protein n=1 Tax=Roseivirga seohaensis TaxID=1914963 RepID=UPI003BABE80E
MSILAQDRPKVKMDRLEQIITQTKSEDSLSKLFSAQIELAREMEDFAKLAEIELKLAKISSYDGIEMQKHAQNALNYYSAQQDTANIIDATYQIAYSKQLQNDYDSTLFFAKEVVYLAEKSQNTVSVISGRLMLSSVHNHLGQYPESLQELNRSKILAENTPNNKSVIIDILNRESFIYYSLGEYDESADRISQIIEILKPEGDARKLNIWSNNLASVFSLCNCVSFEKRKAVLKESINYAKQANFTYGKAFAYKHLADTYRDANQFDSTKYYLEQIEVLLPEINKPDFTGLVSVAQGSYWANVDNNKRAISYFLKGYNIWKTLGKKKDQMDIALYLNNLYQKQKDYANAHKFLNTYVALKDSLFSEEKIREVKELELAYDFRQKQMTDSLKNAERLLKSEYETTLQKRSKLMILFVGVAILIGAIIIYYGFIKQKKLSQLLQVKTDQVESELHQKELLLTEIHHRVKNNFQILSSLLELQAKGVDDQATKDLISEGKSRVRSMALIHNQLYDNDSLTIHLAGYLQNLINEIQKSFEGQTSEVKMDVDPNFTLDIDNMVPLGLIANELVTNAFKYATKNNNQLKLEVSLYEKNGQSVFVFKDNGPGLPSSFDIKTTKSTGIWLISRLTLQLHGRYEYEYDNGAVFKIYFTQSEFVNA